MSIFQRAAVLFWGVISHAYEILPKLLAALQLFGFDKWEQAIRDALHKGGLAIDDFVELHAEKILSIAQLFERIAGLFAAKAALLRELHEEGTRPRPADQDFFNEDRVRYYLDKMLSHDAAMENIETLGGLLTEDLAVAAAVTVKPDVSESPTLNC